MTFRLESEQIAGFSAILQLHDGAIEPNKTRMVYGSGMIEWLTGIECRVYALDACAESFAFFAKALGITPHDKNDDEK